MVESAEWLWHVEPTGTAASKGTGSDGGRASAAGGRK